MTNRTFHKTDSHPANRFDCSSGNEHSSLHVEGDLVAILPTASQHVVEREDASGLSEPNGIFQAPYIPRRSSLLSQNKASVPILEPKSGEDIIEILVIDTSDAEIEIARCSVALPLAQRGNRVTNRPRKNIYF